MPKLACAVCRRTDYMDFDGFLGRADKALRAQLCAWCGDGPSNLMRREIGVRNGGRGRNGKLSMRAIPKLSDEEYELWALLWLSEKLGDYGRFYNRTGRVPVGHW